MEALALPLVGLALKYVPDLIGSLLGPNAKKITDVVTGAAGAIFGTTDPAEIEKAEAAKLDAFKTALTALVEADKAQSAVNEKEAGSSSLFTAGWRPFVGWVCGWALAYQYMLLPFIAWLLAVAVVLFGSKVNIPPPPKLDVSELITILFGMLGLGAMRSYDKLQSTDTKVILPSWLGGKK